MIVAAAAEGCTAVRQLYLHAAAAAHARFADQAAAVQFPYAPSASACVVMYGIPQSQLCDYAPQCPFHLKNKM